MKVLLWVQFAAMLTLELPRSDGKFSPLAATHFLVDKSEEFGVRSELLTST